MTAATIVGVEEYNYLVDQEKLSRCFFVLGINGDSVTDLLRPVPEEAKCTRIIQLPTRCLSGEWNGY